MIKYQVLVDGTFLDVFLDTDNPNQRMEIQYSGDSAAIANFSHWLRFQSGAFGHLIGSDTSPIDLHFVMSQPGASTYQPQLLEGGDIVKVYDPEIPDGAVT